ncbi:hypothetical protein OFB78_29005, partial [Escherichia coli]|nr:hypothetical protein [Escherichia coli]
MFAVVVLARKKLEEQLLTLLPYLAYALSVRRAVDILAGDLCDFFSSQVFVFPQKMRLKLLF